MYRPTSFTHDLWQTCGGGGPLSYRRAISCNQNDARDIATPGPHEQVAPSSDEFQLPYLLHVPSARERPAVTT